MSFANKGIKHALIAMADVGARVVHVQIHLLKAQALSIGRLAVMARVLLLSPWTSPFPPLDCLGVT